MASAIHLICFRCLNPSLFRTLDIASRTFDIPLNQSALEIKTEVHVLRGLSLKVVVTSKFYHPKNSQQIYLNKQ